VLTRLTVRNFKRFGEAEIELGSPVVLIGPNNSGKTSAMQALALWDIGLRRWNERRAGRSAPERRPGVTVNRRDLFAIPVPAANLLWRDLRTHAGSRVDGRQRTDNVRVDVVVDGVGGDGAWSCGLEFDYANAESFYCRPLRLGEGPGSERMPVPAAAGDVDVAFLPPMSGLAATETRLDPGAINVRVGEGRTAEVLRNLCHRIHEDRPGDWERLTEEIGRLFGVRLDPPRYVVERGEIAMSYREGDVALDLSSSGRGLQQTLLLLAYMYANSGAVLLLDEPDAHLEILRQRQIYRLITEAAEASGSQIVAASHSEVLLNEAAGRHMVIAFVGEPHRIDDRGSQMSKALREIGFEQYVQAEQTGWVLYLEGSTDLAILQAFARRLGHEDAMRALDRPFVHYAGNQPQRARDHFHGLREALPGLRGVALFDRLDAGPPDDALLPLLTWERREIENYLCSPATLESYASEAARTETPGPLFAPPEIERRRQAMREAIGQVESAMATLGRGSPWDADAKVSDDFLTPLFAAYFGSLELPNLMDKSSFHSLVDHVPLEETPAEVGAKLDAVAEIAAAAKPRSGGAPP